MSHNVHPYSFRIGILRDWKSRWFRAKRMGDILEVDVTIRAWLMKKLRTLMVSEVEIERSRNTLSVIIKTPRPGLLIGRGGEGIEKLKREILKQFNLKDVRLSVEEVKNPQADAKVVARQVAHDLERRLPFRRILKQTVEKVIATNGVEGVRIRLKGRLDGAEMGRREWLKRGRIPLQTLRADVDFTRDTAMLPYGTIGVAVWIYKGEIFEKDKKGE